MSASTAPRPANARLQAMLHAPIAPTLARLAWPNILMMLAQSATGLIETWFLARLGTPVLAGVALVVPVLMLMQNMSQGATAAASPPRWRARWARAGSRKPTSWCCTRWC